MNLNKNKDLHTKRKKTYTFRLLEPVSADISWTRTSHGRTLHLGNYCKEEHLCDGTFR